MQYHPLVLSLALSHDLTVRPASPPRPIALYCTVTVKLFPFCHFLSLVLRFTSASTFVVYSFLLSTSLVQVTVCFGQTSFVAVETKQGNR